MTCYKLLLLSVSLAFAQAAYPASLVWKVSKDDRYMFIAADTPRPDTSSFEVPAEYIRALKSADAFLVLAKRRLPESATEEEKHKKALFYPDGKDIWSVLDRKTAYRLKKYVKSNYVLDVTGVDTFKPGLIVEILAEVGYHAVNFKPNMEDKMMGPALISGKSLGRIGSTLERWDHLVEMEQGPYLDLINYKLDYFTALPGRIDELNIALESGDAAAIDSFLLDPYRKVYPAAYEYEIVHTVQNLLPHLEAELDSDEVELILLGVQYLVGKDGLLEQLRRKGATVTQF